MSDGMSEAFGMTRRNERGAEEKKYIVLYVLDCEPKVKRFTTFEKAKRFAVKINSIDKRDKNWVDYIIKGKVLLEDK